jgi:hypothetical protein
LTTSLLQAEQEVGALLVVAVAQVDLEPVLDLL